MNDTVDYQRFTTIDTPKAERQKLNVGDIWNNAAICHECDNYVRSCNRHDFRRCSCGNLAVDGGSMYAKRMGKPGSYTNDIIPYADYVNAGEDDE